MLKLEVQTDQLKRRSMITKLRRIRKEKGFTSGLALGEAVGVHKMTVCYWENGHSKPRDKGKFQHAQRLEAILQTPIETLLETDTAAPEGTAGVQTKQPEKESCDAT